MPSSLDRNGGGEPQPRPVQQEPDALEAARREGVLVTYNKIWEVRARAVEGAERKMSQIEELVQKLPKIKRKPGSSAMEMPVLTPDEEKIQKEAIMLCQQYKNLLNQYRYATGDPSPYEMTEEESERFYEASKKGEELPAMASTQAGIDRAAVVAQIESEARKLLGYSYEGSEQVNDAQKALRARHADLIERQRDVIDTYPLYRPGMPFPW